MNKSIQEIEEEVIKRVSKVIPSFATRYFQGVRLVIIETMRVINEDRLN